MTDLYVKRSPMIADSEYNLGVFADTFFMELDVIEVCPVLKLTESAKNMIDRTKLKVYPVKFEEQWVFMFGYGSLYNHSTVPNVSLKLKGDVVVVCALKDISPNEELVWDYGK